MKVAGLERDSSMAVDHDAENPNTMKFMNNRKDRANNTAAHTNEVPDLTAETTKRLSMEANYLNRPGTNHDQEQVLKSAKAKMGKIREENERLKTLLAKITTDYESLQAHLSNLADGGNHNDDDDREQQLQVVCDLTLGRSPSRISRPNYSSSKKKKNDDEERILKLGLNSENIHHEREGNSIAVMKDYMNNKRSRISSDHEESKEEEHVEEVRSSPTKSGLMSSSNKTSNTAGPSGEDDQGDVSLQQPPLKKTRVSIRARCDAPTINDGCQWRKYGQKISKGNPCPRAYYRCTVSPTCPVRKQVQRCPEDMSILITTYEGNHNHPLPISATAIASATSAAASMLQSGSSTSTTSNTTNNNNHNFLLNNNYNHPQAAAASAAGLHGMNFAFSNDTPPAGKLYFPNPTTNINSHPTITLDLTTNPSVNTAVNWPLGAGGSTPAAGYYSLLNQTPRDFMSYYYGYNNNNNNSTSSSKCLNFSSPSYHEVQNATPVSWGSRNNCLNFGTMSTTTSAGVSYDISNYGDLQQKHKGLNASPVVNQVQQTSSSSMDETISMATRAITSNPKFQSVLAAAISSYVGNKGANGNAGSNGQDVVKDNQAAAGEDHRGSYNS